MDLRDELQTTLGVGFTVERELSGGGMSRVYVARDVSLGRDVVVKVLPPEMSAEVSAERFRREIQLGAQLQHPHIVPLLSAGASSSLLFYSMPFVAGESLRERMSRGPALTCGESMRLWREVLDALSYAHSRGIVHRDIKPENILLSNKHALVTDFGIARAIQAATGEARVTSTGMALGTPAYMAPEQAAGDPDVDARADIYSAGLVMYEMLAGHPPFVADSARQMVAAQLTQEAPPLTARDPSAPTALLALVMRCLAKNPSDRPQSAESVLETLDSFVTPAQTASGAKPTRARRKILLAVLTTVVIAVASVGVWSARAGHLPFATPAKPPNDTLRLTVVLVGNKFDVADANLGSSFGDGVLGELAKDPWLRVIPPATVTTALKLAGYDPLNAPRDTVLNLMKRLHTNVYVDLTVSRAGSGFVFSAGAAGALKDNSIGPWAAAANSAADVPAAIERVATQLRRGLVGSRRALPATPWAGLTGDMASVAMPLVIEAWSDFNLRNYGDAVDKARRATRADSAFYPGWVILYLSLMGTPAPNSEWLAALSTAYKLRDHIRSPLDRVLLDADYFRLLGRDAEALAAFDSSARMLPDKFAQPPRALLYGRMRRDDIVARLSRDALDTTYSQLTIMNSRLIDALLSLGKVDEAKAEYRRMLTHADSSESNVRQARYFLATATRDWPSLDALASEELRTPGRDALIRGRQYARNLAAVQGRLVRYDSLRDLPADSTRPRRSATASRGVDLPATRLHVALGDLAGAREMIEKGLAAVPWESREPVNRPYAAMITALALVGDTARGAAIAADWTTHMPPVYKPRDSLDVLVGRSELALSRGDPHEALRLLRLADVKGCKACFYPRYARVFEALHMTDSVASYYEKYASATTPANPLGDAYELARAYRRLGEIYEERRDWKRATQRYQDFVNLWEHADAPLQEAVKDVRARIDRIRSKSG